MKLKNITSEEIETMSFDDVAYAILKEKSKKMKLLDLFNAVCEIMNIDEKQRDNYIADFFTLISTEKRFIGLDKGYWDLRENHTAKIEINEIEEDDDEVEEDEDVEEDSESDDTMYIDETKDEESDEGEDEYKDLVVIDETEDEANL